MKLVGSRNSMLVVAHRAVIRVIMGYFLDIPPEEIPNIEVNLNTVYELEPTAYCTKTKQYVLHQICFFVFCKETSRKFLANLPLSPEFFLSMSMSSFEKITSSVFPELDKDLVPYVASIIEENQKESLDVITDALYPTLSGYEVVPDDEIPNRCKKLISLLNSNKGKKKYIVILSVYYLGKRKANHRSCSILL